MNIINYISLWLLFEVIRHWILAITSLSTDRPRSLSLLFGLSEDCSRNPAPVYWSECRPYRPHNCSYLSDWYLHFDLTLDLLRNIWCIIGMYETCKASILCHQIYLKNNLAVMLLYFTPPRNVQSLLICQLFIYVTEDVMCVSCVTKANWLPRLLTLFVNKLESSNQLEDVIFSIVQHFA